MSASNTTENTVVTQTRRHKLVFASAGEISLPRIVGMAFGNGGVNGQGEVIPPTEDQTDLYNEIFRKEIDSYEIVDPYTIRYLCTLEEGELIGQKISELGLYDEDGDILCIRTMTEKGVDGDIEQTYSVKDIF